MLFKLNNTFYKLLLVYVLNKEQNSVRPTTHTVSVFCIVCSFFRPLNSKSF